MLRQPTIDYDMSLLVVILLQIYNEKEQGQQVKTQNVQFEEK